MPIVDVAFVGEPHGQGHGPSARALADGLGRVFGSPAGRTWVRLHVLAGADYAENGVELGRADWPVFVTVLHARLPDGAALAQQAEAIAAEVASCTGRAADRVHVEFAPMGEGRMGFGGRLVR